MSQPTDKSSRPRRHIVFRAFKLTRDENEALKASAQRRGTTVSALIRQRLARDLRDARQAA